MNDKERRNLEFEYGDKYVNRSGAAVYGDEKRNQLFIRVIDKTGTVRMVESLNVLLKRELREKIEVLDGWVVQVGGKENFRLINLNEKKEGAK